MAINYDGRRFRTVGSDDGNIGIYRQDGDLLWGDFGGGGGVRRGSLCGLCAPDGTLEFAYTMVLTSGEVVSGRCVSTPRVLPDGRIGLVEAWERYGTNPASGVSSLEEV